MAGSPEAVAARFPASVRGAARWLLAIPPTAYIVVLGLVPFGTLLLYSVWVDDLFGIQQTLTADNYRSLVEGQSGAVFMKTLGRTVAIAMAVTVASLAIALPTTYWIVRRVTRHRALVLILLFVPLSTSYLVKVYAWRTVLGENGIINYPLTHGNLLDEPLSFLLFNQFAVALALLSATLPFMILPVYAAMDRVPTSLLEAGSDLGAGASRVFWKVVFPLIRRGIVAGCTFVFVICMGDFISSQLLGGTSGILVGRLIFSEFGLADNLPTGAAMTVATLAVLTLFVLGFGLLARLVGGRGASSDAELPA